jgi:hypothetical protein
MDSVAEFTRAVVPMYRFTKLRCCRKISFACGSDLPTVEHFPNWRALHNRERLTRIEAKFCVQGEGAIVKCRLHESYSRKGALVCTIDNSLHQHAPNGPILHVRFNGDRPNAGDCRTLVQTITPDNLATDFCHYTVKARMSKKHTEQADSDFRRGDIRRETVLFVDRGKRFVTNTATKVRVLW